MSSMFEDSEKIIKALTPIIKKVVAEETRGCLRTYKAVVVAAPNESTGKCTVRLVGHDTELTIPYSTSVYNVLVGNMVLVATPYDSFKNAIVWENIDFQYDGVIPNNSSANAKYNEVITKCNDAITRYNQLNKEYVEINNVYQDVKTKYEDVKIKYEDVKIKYEAVEQYKNSAAESASQAVSAGSSAETAKNRVEQIYNTLTSEDWTFYLADGTSVTKKVCLR